MFKNPQECFQPIPPSVSFQIFSPAEMVWPRGGLSFLRLPKGQHRRGIKFQESVCGVVVEAWSRGIGARKTKREKTM